MTIKVKAKILIFADLPSTIAQTWQPTVRGLNLKHIYIRSNDKTFILIFNLVGLHNKNNKDNTNSFILLNNLIGTNKLLDQV